MICPNCKNEISDAHSHCYHCGYDLTEHIAPLRCVCGSIRPGSHIYCTDCGRVLSRDSVVLDKAEVAAFYAERAAANKKIMEENTQHSAIEDLIVSTTPLNSAAPKTPAGSSQKKDSSFLIVGLLSLVALGVLFAVGFGKKDDVGNQETTKTVAAKTTAAKDSSVSKSAAANTVKPVAVASTASVDTAKKTVVKKEIPQSSSTPKVPAGKVSGESNYIAPVKGVSAESVADVAEKNGKKLRYLVTTSGGTIGFFGDGTYTVLPQGTFTKESIKALYAAPTTGNYKGSLSVGAVDKNWLVVDYKWTKVPQ